MDKDAQLRKLVDSLSPRTAHQYKSYCNKYIQWLKDVKIIAQHSIDASTVEDSLLYKELPLSCHLVHWFLLDTLISGTGTAAVNNDTDDDDDFKIATLKKIISSLKFLNKLCTIHGNKIQAGLDEKYLELVIKLHSHWATVTVSKDVSLPILKISLNLWNSNTENLSEKFFKTGLEKLRFLVDFHFRNFTNLSYDQRSKIKLSQLKPHENADGEDDYDVVTIDHQVWSSLQVYLPNATPQIRSHTPMALLSQQCPFLCPLTSLASYLFLRFYGITSVSKGDGFPNLLKQASDDDEPWLELPLIRGKSLLDYPRDETLSNYYSAVFRYCHLPYKRREYFAKESLEFPTWSHQDFVEFFKDFPKAQEFAFKYKVPFDFSRIMNYKSPYGPSKKPKNSKSSSKSLPETLLVQLFPEIEHYKRHLNTLSSDAKDFIKLMETLRKRFLLNLPWIYKFFPHHDLFKDPIFQNADFQAYFYEVVGNATLPINKHTHKHRHKTIESTVGTLPFEILPGYERLSETDLHNLLMEPSSQFSSISNANNISNNALVTLSPSNVQDSTIDDLMKQTFQFVQYQTLTNFQILLSLLSKIFDKLEMRKSSREFMIHQLNLLHDTIRDNINTSKPNDVEKYIKKEEEQEQEQAKNSEKKRIKPHNNGLLAIDDPSEDDSEEEGDQGNMQEELKFMINELVGERVRSTVQQQMEKWELKVQAMVDDKISAVMNSKRRVDEDQNNSKSKRQRLSTTPSLSNNESGPSASAIVNLDIGKTESHEFRMDPNIDSVEAVILEWFTPNPEMNNQCVHSMNKVHGKSWRTTFEKLYKERKLIVEFYIHLVNEKKLDRFEAVELCESMKATNAADVSLSSLAQLLKDWKKKHGNSFEGLLEEATESQI